MKSHTDLSASFVDTLKTSNLKLSVLCANKIILHTTCICYASGYDINLLRGNTNLKTHADEGKDCQKHSSLSVFKYAC